MSLKADRIEEVRFSVSNLTANSAGLFDIYTNNSVNGAIQSISVGSNIYTNTGSLLFYLSGTDNVVQKDLIIRIRAGSMMQTFYPYVTISDNQSVLGSFTNMITSTQFVSNEPIRIVGSGLGNGASGMYVVIKYR